MTVLLSHVYRWESVIVINCIDKYIIITIIIIIIIIIYLCFKRMTYLAYNTNLTYGPL